MPNRTCPMCSTPIPADASAGRIFCSKRCGNRHSRRNNSRGCSIDGCTGSHLARGLCGTHYNQAYQPNRHANSVADSRRRRERDKLDPEKVAKERDRQRAKAKRLAVTQMTGWRRLADDLPREIDTEMDALESLRYIDCAWCGEHFWTRNDQAERCSERCVRAAKRVRRRGRIAGASGSYTWAEVMSVFVAIDRVCAYCHAPQASGDIEPDHVIALSVGGSNSITNVVPCCKPCNSDKRELTMAEWAADRARRNLEPRSLHEGVKHLTLATLA